MSKTYEFVSVEQDGHLLLVTLNRPELYNALHNPAHHELDQIWNDFSANDDLWVAILTGAGEKAFCAGNDLKYTAEGGGGTTPASGFGGITNRFDLEKPVIAAVNGVAMGGGMEVALSCDIILAADTARFALPEVKVGFFAAAGGVQRLSREIGRKAAMEMMLTGRHVGAEEAKILGIANEVVPAADLMSAARAKADELLSNSPSAIKATKRVLNQLNKVEQFDEGLALSNAALADLMKTEDFTEGVQAFVAKRKPEWKNR